MRWTFPVASGDYEVRLFFAETNKHAQRIGSRKFDVTIEGAIKLDDYDVFANVGGFTGVMKTFRVASDESLNVEFSHVVGNPMVSGIEVVQVPAT